MPFRGRTRLVGWAKVLLPLAALVLLSTLFLLAREPQGPSEIPFARIEEIARESRVDAPRLAGLAPDGTAVTLAARRLTLLGDGVAAEAPSLSTRSPSGLVARLTAATGEVLAPSRTLRLAGGVTLEGASPQAGAFSARMGEATADLDSGTVTALGGVEATTRLGSVAAATLRVEQGGGAALVVFNGGVRLVYHPPAPSPEAFE